MAGICIVIYRDRGSNPGHPTKLLDQKKKKAKLSTTKNKIISAKGKSKK